MKYWTLFTLRMMARAGLSLAVMLWVAGQSGFSHISVEFSRSFVRTETFGDGIALHWLPLLYAGMTDGITTSLVPENDAKPNLHMAGLNIWYAEALGWHFLATQIDHWLLCLSFLIATMATWPRKKSSTSKEDKG